MGSLRNPVGPLPSSIYWRRRAILASMFAVLALLITWVVTSGGGGGNRNDADGGNGKNPTASITPGPSGSDPAISQAPGGRDESSGGGDGSGESGGSAGSGGSGGSGSGSSASGGAGSGGGGDDGEGGGGSGDTVPAGSSLPNCTAGSVKLTLRSVSNSYTPDEKPTFELIARNSSSSDCKLDLGPKNAVLTITQAESDDEIWSSADCPTSAASILFRVPAENRVTRTVEWNRKASAPQCATPPALTATPGTYLVEAKTPGLPKSQTSFVLKKD
ncbi:hypothetical protein O1Q96_03955 [Streptomyces sp. Qhu-G9]|uniref:hypothetical protein n=1 Tax=Streptomyces sp. Qhu-G9 TaxID=3452799 RepID=UPI0022AC8D9A|nr:hypothetical protein [Streptomyces aurantiacus]WAU78979.1 hypothetical protein O1Q96_03955 [Streptomyces aurantiacus]